MQYFGSPELCNLAKGKSIHVISDRKENSGKRRLPACPVRQPAERKRSSTPRFCIECLRQAASNSRLAACAPRNVVHCSYSKLHRQIVERAARYLKVVKGNGVIGELLIFFVAF